MKLTKFDYIQIVFNATLIAGLVLNLLFLTGHAPRWFTTVGLVLAVAGCIFTNVFAKGDNNAHRTEVTGNPVLAGLTYLTGAGWVITYGLSLFIGTQGVM